HYHPDLLSIRREERLVRRAPDVSYVLYGVGRGIDEIHGIGADSDHSEGTMVGRKAQAMHQQLAPVERTKTSRQWLAEPADTQQLVVDGVSDRNRVGELLRDVDAIATTDWDVRIGGDTRDLPGQGALRATENCRREESCQTRGTLHITAPWLDRGLTGFRIDLPQSRHLHWRSLGG